jgi:hypothetical protein
MNVYDSERIAGLWALRVLLRIRQTMPIWSAERNKIREGRERSIRTGTVQGLKAAKPDLKLVLQGV